MNPRPRYEMPTYFRNALAENNLMDAYRSRPPYQQNDYIGWIQRAKLEATKQKRLNQMLDELKKGDVYMKMKWKPK
jgi:uncharacterized protein YdeI (YjbR/CyaY-like superfamily)